MHHPQTIPDADDLMYNMKKFLCIVSEISQWMDGQTDGHTDQFQNTPSSGEGQKGRVGKVVNCKVFQMVCGHRGIAAQ